MYVCSLLEINSSGVRRYLYTEYGLLEGNNLDSFRSVSHHIFLQVPATSSAAVSTRLGNKLYSELHRETSYMISKRYRGIKVEWAGRE
jgi:hypothetical protein